MIDNHSELSLDRGVKNHFSISIFSLLVYLSLIFLVGLVAVGQSLSSWQKDIFGHLTLQILPDFQESYTLDQIKNNLDVILNDVNSRKNMVKMNTIIHGNGSKVIINEILKYEKIIKNKSIKIQ